jgi:hypothetical protein
MHQELLIQSPPPSTTSGRILLTVGISLSEIQVDKTNFRDCSGIDPKLSVSSIACPGFPTNCGFRVVGTAPELSGGSP